MLCVLALPLAGYAAWLEHRRRTAPPLPDFRLQIVDPLVVRVVAEASAEVRRQPRSAAAWGHLGQLLSVHSQAHEADYCLAQAQRLSPKDPRWPYLRACAKLPDVDAALPDLQQAVSLSERYALGNTAPRLVLAEALFQKGNHAKAEEHLKRVVESEPDNPRAHYNLGLIASARNSWESARTSFLRSQTSSMARKRSSFQLALVCRMLGDERRAEEYGREAAQAPEDKPWGDPYLQDLALLATGRSYFYELAVDLEQQGQTQRAIRLMEEVIKEFPDDDSYVEMAKNLLQTHEYAKVEDLMRKALALKPDKVQAHYYLSMALFRQGLKLTKMGPEQREAALEKFRDAELHSRRATEFMPTHSWAYVYRARSLKYLDRQDEAIEALRDALKHDLRHTEAYIFLATMLMEKGQRQQAQELLQRARLAVPDDPRLQKAIERVAAQRLPGDP